MDDPKGLTFILLPSSCCLCRAATAAAAFLVPALPLTAAACLPPLCPAPPSCSYGYGLPISRLYARYFGGDLSIISMEGYGTGARPC